MNIQHEPKEQHAVLIFMLIKNREQIVLCIMQHTSRIISCTTGNQLGQNPTGTCFFVFLFTSQMRGVQVVYCLDENKRGHAWSVCGVDSNMATWNYWLPLLLENADFVCSGNTVRTWLVNHIQYQNFHYQFITFVLLIYIHIPALVLSTSTSPPN